MRILALRGYRDAKHAIESASKDNPVPEAVSNSRAARLWGALMHVKRDDWSLEEAERSLAEGEVRK